MTVSPLERPPISDITVTLKRLVDLLEEEETDEYGILRPTQLAFKSAMRFVVEAYERLGDRFPKASASTDIDGGICLTWSRLAPDC